MFKGFREFVLRGNVVDLAVGVVIGAAFGTVVSAFVKDLLTPVIAAVAGKPDFSSFLLRGPWGEVSLRRLRQYAYLISVDRCGRVLLCGFAGQYFDEAF